MRLDSGVETGSVIGGQFDSMLAKLIVTGATRDEALERVAARAGRVQRRGPGHRHPVPPRGGRPTRRSSATSDGFTVHTRWIETEWDNTVEPFTGGEPLDEEETIAAADGRRRGRRPPRSRCRCPATWPSATAAARRGPGVDPQEAQGPQARLRTAARRRSGDAVTAPMQGTVVKVAVEEGQEVAAGDLVVVLEAMKMENPVTAHKDGTITGLAVEAGAAITQGTVLAEDQVALRRLTSGVTRLRCSSTVPKYFAVRVDDDGLAAVDRCAPAIAGHLLERDLLRPTDVHDAVQRRRRLRARATSEATSSRGDRLDQRVGNAHLVADDQRLR